MKILLTGSTGQLGQEFVNFDSPHILLTPSRLELDITKRASVEKYIERFRPDWIINSAAWTNVNLAEKNEGKVLEINHDGPENLAIAAVNHGAKLVQISTDYVFDGDKEGDYYPSDITNPINVYGKSKEAAERTLIQNYSENCLIVRTSWLYSRHGQNFVKTIVKKILKNEKQIKVVSDQIGKPTRSIDLVKYVYLLMQAESVTGEIFHGVGPNATSWYELATQITKNMNLDPSIISPISYAELEMPLRRPSNSKLHSTAPLKSMNFEFPKWEDALASEIDSIILAVRRELKDEVH